MYAIPQSRQRTPLSNSDFHIDFSLETYRNEYFISNDPKKVLCFFEGFKSREELLNWMRERPKGVGYIHEVEGEKEIVVVIPTGNISGEFAIRCREDIFKGLHIIFVESGEIPDPFFNVGRNVNIGIRKALSYNPKWIILSADDVYKIDDIQLLKVKLSQLDDREIDAVFISESKYHSIPVRFSKARFTRFLIMMLKRNLPVKEKFSIGLKQISLENRFKIKYFVSPRHRFQLLKYKHGYKFTSFTDFGILSANYLRQHSDHHFDETFVNAQEDHDVNMRLSSEGVRCIHIPFRLGDYIGSSFGMGIARELRELAGFMYLNYKWENRLETLDRE